MLGIKPGSSGRTSSALNHGAFSLASHLYFEANSTGIFFFFFFLSYRPLLCYLWKHDPASKIYLKAIGWKCGNRRQACHVGSSFLQAEQHPSFLLMTVTLARTFWYSHTHPPLSSGSHCRAQAGLQLVICMPYRLECWNYRYVPSSLSALSFGRTSDVSPITLNHFCKAALLHLQT